jgi:hypothetical protein
MSLVSALSRTRLETTLADSNVLAKRVANFMLYFQALFHYNNISGYICTLWRFVLKLRRGNNLLSLPEMRVC